MSSKKVVSKNKKRKPRGKAKVTAKTNIATPEEFKNYKPSTQFQKGNDLWKLRVKVGQERFFTDPVDMLTEFEKYVSWAIENPVISVKPVIEEGVATLQDVPLRRPITVGAFCFIIGCNEDYLRNFRNDVRKTPRLSAFGPVIDCIYQFVEETLMEGAVVGQFNANLISKKLGLVEKSDITTNGKDVGVPTFNIVSEAPEFAKGESSVNKKRDEKEY